MARITLFAQVIQKLPKDLIKSLVRKHGTDKHAKGFNTWSHLVSMIFCQFADCVSLREISNGLHSAGRQSESPWHSSRPVEVQPCLSERASFLRFLPGLLLCTAELFRTAGWVLRSQVPLQERSLCPRLYGYHALCQSVRLGSLYTCQRRCQASYAIELSYDAT